MSDSEMIEGDISLGVEPPPPVDAVRKRAIALGIVQVLTIPIPSLLFWKSMPLSVLLLLGHMGLSLYVFWLVFGLIPRVERSARIPYVAAVIVIFSAGMFSIWRTFIALISGAI